MNISNNPPVILELTKEEAAFLKENCSSNIAVGLEVLTTLERRSSQEKIIHMMEMFKAIKKKLDALGVPSRD